MVLASEDRRSRAQSVAFPLGHRILGSFDLEVQVLPIWVRFVQGEYN